jgi:ubiquinone/menaquinone biosynthesis C-methylase UbiE
VGDPLKGEDVELRITKAVERMVREVGLVDHAIVRESVEKEILRTPARGALDDLVATGFELEGARLLDLGAGLGSISVEAVLRGALPVAVEPDDESREIAGEQLRRAGGGVVVAAYGESLPFRSDTFDGAVSLQVLEHVPDPHAFLREAYRVLKPGGFFFLSCENYLSFREPHYRVAWFPLLPKPIGAFYLRLRGRPPRFLLTSVTYTTLPWVTRMLRDCGFISMRERHIQRVIDAPTLIKSRWKRAIVRAARCFASAERLTWLTVRLRDAERLCTGVIYELLRKPPAP